MEAAIAMLSDLLLTIAHASEEQALELRESEQDISSVGQLHDPVAERTHLAECLEKIRAQVTRRNATGISRHARAEDEMYAGNSPRNLR